MEATVLARVRGVIALIGVAAVFALFAAKPFFSPAWRELPGNLAVLVAALTAGLILLINKFACGTWFPGRTKAAQPIPVRPRSGGGDPAPLLIWMVGLTGFGLLTVYVLKHYSLNRHELYLGALIGPLMLIALVNGVLYLRRHS